MGGTWRNPDLDPNRCRPSRLNTALCWEVLSTPDGQRVLAWNRRGPWNFAQAHINKLRMLVECYHVAGLPQKSATIGNFDLYSTCLLTFVDICVQPFAIICCQQSSGLSAILLTNLRVHLNTRHVEVNGCKWSANCLQVYKDFLLRTEGTPQLFLSHRLFGWMLCRIPLLTGHVSSTCNLQQPHFWRNPPHVHLSLGRIVCPGVNQHTGDWPSHDPMPRPADQLTCFRILCPKTLPTPAPEWNEVDREITLKMHQAFGAMVNPSLDRCENWISLKIIAKKCCNHVAKQNSTVRCCLCRNKLRHRSNSTIDKARMTTHDSSFVWVRSGSMCLTTANHIPLPKRIRHWNPMNGYDQPLRCKNCPILIAVFQPLMCFVSGGQALLTGIALPAYVIFVDIVTLEKLPNRFQVPDKIAPVSSWCLTHCNVGPGNNFMQYWNGSAMICSYNQPREPNSILVGPTLMRTTWLTINFQQTIRIPKLGCLFGSPGDWLLLTNNP